MDNFFLASVELCVAGRLMGWVKRGGDCCMWWVIVGRVDGGTCG